MPGGKEKAVNDSNGDIHISSADHGEYRLMAEVVCESSRQLPILRQDLVLVQGYDRRGKITSGRIDETLMQAHRAMRTDRTIRLEPPTVVVVALHGIANVPMNRPRGFASEAAEVSHMVM
jgi:hypothetical protein